MATESIMSVSENEQKDVENTDNSFHQAIAIEEKYEDPSEGYLLRGFETVTEKCIDKCLNPTQLSKCYKHIRKNSKDMIQNLFEQIMDQTKRNILDELNSFVRQENIPGLLSEMDKILSESPNSEGPVARPAWRPSGDPEIDSRAHIMAKKVYFLEKMKVQLRKVQKEEQILKEKVQEKRKKLNAITSEIESVMSHSKLAANTSAKFEIENSENMLDCSQKLSSLCELLSDTSKGSQSTTEI